MSEFDDLVAAYSPAFQELHVAIGAAVRERFPATKQVAEFGMAAYAVPLRDPPAKEDWKGTMPHDVFVIGPTEKKAGITIHFWHPHAPYLLKEHAEELQAAGFRPMVGCLQWNRKAELPLDALETLLDATVDIT